MSNKIILAKSGCQGNLKLYEQNTFVCYLQREIRENGEILEDKICLELLAPSSNGEMAVKSYYMPKPENVSILILDLFKGLMKLEKERGNLTEQRIDWYRDKFSKALKEIGLDTRKGKYDVSQKY